MKGEYILHMFDSFYILKLFNQLTTFVSLCIKMCVFLIHRLMRILSARSYAFNNISIQNFEALITLIKH